jgi:hypothetical protein
MTSSHESTSTVLPSEQQLYGTYRDELLARILPNKYDRVYAKDSGLLDMFYYNPETGEDGLAHMLAGDITVAENGAFLAQGFHHELSGIAAWPDATTYVDRSHLADRNAKGRQPYAEAPFNPYGGQVVVSGLAKYAIHRDPQTGEKRLQPARNAMYPYEYDALAVMQAVRIARESRDKSEDRLALNPQGQKVLISEGSAPLIDGTTPMRVRLVLDPETEKVMTAIPVLPSSPAMRLTPSDIDRHLYGA